MDNYGTNTPDDIEILVSNEDPNVGELLKEFKMAGVMPNGFYDVTYDEEIRRMLWAGQSPDGRKWDENLPEGQEARPWDGCADTRVPLVDEICNEEIETLCAAFWRAELRAATVNVEMGDLAGAVSGYLHWLLHVKLKRRLRLEVELAAQFSREYGWCAAYVGWEREISKRRVTFTLEQLTAICAKIVQTPGQTADTDAYRELPRMILDPTLDAECVAPLQEMYKHFVQGQLQGAGFYESELEDDQFTGLKPAAARKIARELREQGTTQIPYPYLAKNQPMIWVAKPYLEFLAARGTAMLQQARAIFWRRWMTEAEVDAAKATGWNEDWCEQVKKTKGNISSWAGALGQTSLTGPATKTIANTTYLKITEENNPLIEVVYGLVKKVDEDGVSSVWQTVFSPHITRDPKRNETELYASHEMLDYGHGQYPVVELKRENIGRSLVETRSVAEVAGTWQGEEKKQRDMLFNRADWDTLPPVSVPRLGGVDYRLGPGAQVPLARGAEIKAVNLGAPEPKLAVQILELLKARADGYFGRPGPNIAPAKSGAHQEKIAGDFYSFWGEILLHCFALTVQYNPEEITAVTGRPELAQLDPANILQELDVSMEFDIAQLNPDYLLQKMDTINSKLLPQDATGAIDRSALTQTQARWLDPGLAAKIIQPQASASQALFREVQQTVISMADGNEAEYTENDAAAPTKLQFLQGIVQRNPKYLAKLGHVRDPQTPPDERFQELLTNYQKNLQQSVDQQQNKVIGRIGVRPVSGGGAPQPGQPAQAMQ